MIRYCDKCRKSLPVHGCDVPCENCGSPVPMAVLSPESFKPDAGQAEPTDHT